MTMAWQIRLTMEQALRLNEKAVEMLLEDEDPSGVLGVLDKAIIAEDKDDGQ